MNIATGHDDVVSAPALRGSGPSAMPLSATPIGRAHLRAAAEHGAAFLVARCSRCARVVGRVHATSYGPLWRSDGISYLLEPDERAHVAAEGLDPDDAQVRQPTLSLLCWQPWWGPDAYCPLHRRLEVSWDQLLAALAAGKTNVMLRPD